MRLLPLALTLLLSICPSLATTIAFDGFTLSADDQLTESHRRMLGATKIVYSSKRKQWMAGAGDYAKIQKIMCWFLKGEDKPCNVEGEFEILIVTADGDLLSFNGSMTDPCVLGRQKYAMGSGKDFALAAMDSGLNSHDAVLVAAKRDIYTSTNVVTFQIIKQEERF